MYAFLPKEETGKLRYGDRLPTPADFTISGIKAYVIVPVFNGDAENEFYELLSSDPNLVALRIRL